MKKMLKVIVRQSRRLCTIIAVIGFTVSCGGGPGGGSSNSSPIKVEPMSNKTAMEYFRDEGIRAGINLGNGLEAYDKWTNPGNPIAVETFWGAPKANQALFNGYKDQGFNIVRIPVSWVGHIGSAPNYKVEEAYLKRVAEVVGYAKNAGLKAVINVHHDGSSLVGDDHGWLSMKKAVNSKSDCDQITDKFAKVWTQIAEYFTNYGDYLMFEGMNEIFNVDYIVPYNWGLPPGAQPEYDIINAWNQTFLDSVRATGGNNASRYLIFPGYGTNWEYTANGYFKLPVDTVSGRQIVSFHFYDPSDFVYNCNTHEWPNTWYGGRGEKAYIDTAFGEMKTYFTSKDIPVIIGENGPFRYTKNDANTPAARANRLDYIDYMYGKARENEIVPCFWECFYVVYEGQVEGDSSLFNRNTGAPNSEESAEVIQHMINAVK